MKRTKRASLRCSRPLCSSQSTGGTPPGRPTRGDQTRPRGAVTTVTRSCPVPQDPTACMRQKPHPEPFQTPEEAVLDPKVTLRHLVKCSTHELPAKNVCLRSGFWTPKRQMLLRKEVIQPHLPVRLPCYDLVLITDPTFDGSLHKGWATGFRCYRLS